MLFGLLPLALLLAAAGALLLVAARYSTGSREAAPGSATLPAARLAARLTDGLDRTAHAVDVLVDPRPAEEVLRTRETDPEQQQATYAVVGGGLLGLAVVLVSGVVLLLVG